MISYCLMTPWVSVISLSEENSIYLRSAGSVLKQSQRLSGGKTHRCCQEQEFISSGCHLLGSSFTSSLKSNLCTTLTNQNVTESNCIISYTHHTPALQPNVIFIGIYLSLSNSNGRLAFLQHKQLPRSSSNSTVIFCRWFSRFV